MAPRKALRGDRECQCVEIGVGGFTLKRDIISVKFYNIIETPPPSTIPPCSEIFSVAGAPLLEV